MPFADVLQCQSLDILLQPVNLTNFTTGNGTGLAANGTDSPNELRFNTCFEQGILQPVMTILMLLILTVGLICLKPDKGKERPKWRCFAFVTPVVLSTLSTLASFGVLMEDWMNLPLPGAFSPSYYGNLTNPVRDGTNGTMYLFVGDSAVTISGLLVTVVMAQVAWNGKTPFVTTLWTFFEAIFLCMEARLPVKSLIARVFSDEGSSTSTRLMAQASWEGMIEMQKEPTLTSWLRVVRALLVALLALVLMCRRETPRTTFDPRDHMPADYEKMKNKKKASKKVGDGTREVASPVPETPGGTWAISSPGESDESTVHYTLRFSNEVGGSLCTRLMFGFVSSLLVAGSRFALEMKQLFLLSGDDDAVVNARKLQAAWTKAGMKETSLFRSVLRVYAKQIVASGVMMLFSIFCTLLQPQVLYQLLDFIQQDGTTPVWWGYLWAGLGTLCIFLQQVLQTQVYISSLLPVQCVPTCCQQEGCKTPKPTLLSTFLCFTHPSPIPIVLVCVCVSFRPIGCCLALDTDCAVQ